MLVKKKNPEWRPSEKPELEVGGVIDITDARALILNGEVVAVDEDGTEISAYDLFGEITENEFGEFKAWREMEQAKVMKERLEKEQAELKAKLPAVEAAPVVEAKPEVKKVKVDMTANWQALMKMGRDLKIYKVGMTKEELVKAINEA